MEDEDQTYPVPQAMGFEHATEGSLRYQINCTDVIEEIEHTLKGEIVMTNDKGQQFWAIPEGYTPMINSHGINSILTILRSRLNKIFILSDLDKETIEKITISIGRNVIDNLYYNWELYEIKDDAAASLILGLVTETVYATLRKGYMGNYLKFLRTIQQVQEVQHQTITRKPPAQESSSMNPMNMIFGRKKR